MNYKGKGHLDELEKVVADVTTRPSVLSGIEPATDPVAELEEMQDEDDEAPLREVATLRDRIEDLKTHLATALARGDKLDRDLDLVVGMTVSARLNIRTALAIIHLREHDPQALSSNAMPGVYEALTNAATDLEKAEIKADRIPF